MLRIGLCASWYAVTAPPPARAVAFLRLSYAGLPEGKVFLGRRAALSSLRKVGAVPFLLQQSALDLETVTVIVNHHWPFMCSMRVGYTVHVRAFTCA